MNWIKTSEQLPEQGQLIVKRWISKDSVWAGVFSGSAKDSSFDEWFPLPSVHFDQSGYNRSINSTKKET